LLRNRDVQIKIGLIEILLNKRGVVVDQAALKNFQESTRQINIIDKHYGTKINRQLLRNRDVQFKIWLLGAVSSEQ
jgi:hypothetical protein